MARRYCHYINEIPAANQLGKNIVVIGTNQAGPGFVHADRCMIVGQVQSHFVKKLIAAPGTDYLGLGTLQITVVQAAAGAQCCVVPAVGVFHHIARIIAAPEILHIRQGAAIQFTGITNLRR